MESYWSIGSSGAQVSQLNSKEIFDCEFFCDASDVDFGGFIATQVDAQLERNLWKLEWRLKE